MAFTLHLLDGAELGGLERASATGSGWAVNSTVRAGANGAYCYRNTTAINSTISIDAFEYQGSSQGAGNIVGFWWKESGASGSDLIIQMKDVVGTDNIFTLQRASSTIANIWMLNSAGGFFDSAIGALQVGVWQFIEFYWVTGAAGAYELFIDNVSFASGTADFNSSGGDPGILKLWHETATADTSIDDLYFGTGATSSADRLGGMDIFATTGDGSATTGGDTLDAGTWANVQEIPANDTNLASYNAPAGGNTDEREAPDTLAVQTNLTGAVTDIDDDPDSPDGLWLTASGSSTARVTFPTPTGSPTVGAGLQNFRVLLRKNATGPSGGGTEAVTPDAVLTSSGLDVSGGISYIQDDPDSPDANWFTTTGSSGEISTSTTNPTNGANIDTATNAQQIKLWLRKDASGGGNPTFTAEIHDSGGLHESLVIDASVTSSTGTLYTYNWTAAGLSSPNDVEIHLDLTKGGGGPNERNVEVGATRWNMAYTGAETQPGYEVRLYENGTVVSAVTAATGNLTDAGGNTIVQLAWDATELATADGSLVECYVNQTSGADRYIEVGAVEWNCKYPTPIPAESGWVEADSGNRLGPSGFKPLSVDTYYFDASDDAATGTNWSNLSLAFNGIDNQDASITEPDVNVMHGGGTNAPITGDTVVQVRGRWKFRKPSQYTSLSAEWFTDGKAASLGSDTQTVNDSTIWADWVILSVPSGGWTWAKIAALEVEFTPVMGTPSGSFTASVFQSEVEVTSQGATATLNEIVGMSTYIRTQYSGSGSTLTHSLYRGNDVDGMTELSLGAATAGLADFFDITDSAAIMPLITEQTRVGFGHPINVDVDIDCTEIIGMVAHVPLISIFAYHFLKRRDEMRTLITL